jgi:hypothetical protein
MAALSVVLFLAFGCGARDGLRVPDEAGPEATEATVSQGACEAGPAKASAVALVGLPELSDPSPAFLLGNWLYLNVREPYADPQSSFYRVPALGGRVEAVSLPGWHGTTVIHDGSRFYYVVGRTETIEGSKQWIQEGVRFLDPSTGASGVVVEGPTEWIATLPGVAGIFWLETVSEYPVSRNLHWAEAESGARRLVAHHQPISQVAAHDRSLYWTRWDGPTTALFLQPLDDSPPVLLHTFDGSVRVFGTDEEYVYLLGSEGAALRMPKFGGEPFQVSDLLSQGESMLDLPRIAGPYIYWIEYNDQDTLRRMPKAGGDFVWISLGPSRWVSPVVHDECNVYWNVVNPPVIMIQSH